MNNQLHSDNQANSDNDGFSQKNVVGSHPGEMKKDIAGQKSITLSL